MALTDEQLLRYSRHILLPQLDTAGQEKLLAARILIVGLGGLGSPVAMYLASSGIGTLVLNDFDTVELHNLQRQIIHVTESVGLDKTDSARRHLHKLNPDCQIFELSRQLTESELADEVALSTAVVDCTDNFATRLLLNRVCHRQRKPLVSGAAIRYEGQVTVFHHQNETDACYQCLYPETGEQEAGCTANGVLAPAVGVIGSLQAIEVIKIVVSLGETLRNRLLVYDALRNDFRIVRYNRDPQCAICAQNDF